MPRFMILKMAVPKVSESDCLCEAGIFKKSTSIFYYTAYPDSRQKSEVWCKLKSVTENMPFSKSHSIGYYGF